MVTEHVWTSGGGSGRREISRLLRKGGGWPRAALDKPWASNIPAALRAVWNRQTKLSVRQGSPMGLEHSAGPPSRMESPDKAQFEEAED